MMSSVSPSASRPVASSPAMLANGRTASDALPTRPGAGWRGQKCQAPTARIRTSAAAAAHRTRPPTMRDRDRDPGGFSDGFASAGGFRLSRHADLQRIDPDRPSMFLSWVGPRSATAISSRRFTWR